jgi:hypothetical protein
MAIHIKKENRGRFKAYLKRAGVRKMPKMPQFARNAKRWHHAEGGQVQGNLWDTNRAAFVDSTLNANKGMEWVQRLRQPNTPDMQLPGVEGRSTHYMSDNGQGYVFPQIINRGNGLEFLGNEDNAYNYAINNNAGIQFNTPEQASWFAANGYKKGTNVLKGKYPDGGKIDYTGMGLGFMNNKKIYNRGDHTANLLSKLTVRNSDELAHGDWARYYAGYPLTGKGVGALEGDSPRTYDLQYSNYAPSNAKNKDAKYVANKDPEFVNQILKYYNENYKGEPLHPSYTVNPKKRGDTKTYNTFGDLGNFKIDSGQDENGKYVSYYDVWNYGRHDNPDVTKKEWLGAVKPYEVYDRIYLDDMKNKKKYAYGGISANSMQSTQKSVAGMIPYASIFSSLGGAAADIIDPKDPYGVSKSDWAAGGRAAVDPSMSLSRSVSDISKGKFDNNTFWDLAFPIYGEILSNKDARADRAAATAQPPQYVNPGYSPSFPYGGMSPDGTDIEVERGEVLRDPNDGSLANISDNAPTHAQGGVDVTAEPGTQIYGKLKVKSGRFKGQTYKDAADSIRKEIARLEKN